MPLYEYECATCLKRFERRQKVTDEPVKICPECGGPCRRVINPVGIIFKGSGWYITDSRKSDSATTSTTSAEKSNGDKAGEAAAATKPSSESGEKGSDKGAGKVADKGSSSAPASSSGDSSKAGSTT